MTMPPGLKFGFASSTNDSSTSFGSEMGVFNGTDYGRKLMRGEFNAQAIDFSLDLNIVSNSRIAIRGSVRSRE